MPGGKRFGASWSTYSTWSKGRLAEVLAERGTRVDPEAFTRRQLLVLIRGVSGIQEAPSIPRLGLDPPPAEGS